MSDDLGFNRGRNNRTNTYSAVLEADKRASGNIEAVELGNEPDRKPRDRCLLCNMPIHS